MKTTKTLLLCCAFYAGNATAQSLRYAMATPYLGLSAYSSLQADPFSFTGNPAALTGMKHAGAGVYGERRFLLAETSAYCFAAAFPGKMGHFGLKLNYAGFKNFNENSIGLAYARNLGPKMALGIQFNHYGYRIPAYGNASVFNFEAGALVRFTPKLTGGIHIYNPVGGKLGKTGNEKLASAYRVGFGFDASRDFFVGTQVSKEEDKPVDVVAGMQYRFARHFFARGGISSATTTAFMGAGTGWSNLRFDVSVSYHPQLGISPGILLIMDFKKAEE